MKSKHRSRRLALLLAGSDASLSMRDALEIGAVTIVVMCLTLIAQANFRTQTINAMLSEAYSLTAGSREKLIVHRASTGRWPDADAKRESDPDERESGQYVYDVLSDGNGTLIVQFRDDLARPEISGRQLVFRAMTTAQPGTPVVLVCGSHLPPPGFTGYDDDKTTIEERFLPSACRAF